MTTGAPDSASTLSEADRCLRLFLSVDISGSTEYKSKHSNFKEYANHWARFYESFFQDFPARLAGEVFKEFKVLRGSLQVWKCLGDEIIYEDVVISSGDCHKLVTAFYNAIVGYDKVVRETAGKPGLRVKGTCWTAGFPIRNAKIKVPNKLSSYSTDYIGPDMDIGFRLSKVSRPERVVVSMDLADILTRQTFAEPLAFYQVGWEVLKGVFGDKPYPVIWVRKEEEIPYFLPWEDHLCPLNAIYRKKEKIDIQSLQSQIDSIRKELPQLELFKPYFDPHSMPLEHKDIWDKWEKDRMKNQEGHLDQGGELEHPSDTATV